LRNSGKECHWPEVCRTLGKAVAAAWANFYDNQGRENHPLSHSQGNDVGKNNRWSTQQADLDHANLFTGMRLFSEGEREAHR
jgi:hypothetical protein